MIKPEQLEQAVNSGQERFAFFFLALSASAIAFAVVRTEDVEPAIWMLFIAGAILCWAGSFAAGCLHVSSKLHAQSASLGAARISRGQDEDVGSHPALMAKGLQVVTNIVKEKAKQSAWAGVWQIWLFAGGAVVYVVGHAIRIAT